VLATGPTVEGRAVVLTVGELPALVLVAGAVTVRWSVGLTVTGATGVLPWAEEVASGRPAGFIRPEPVLVLLPTTVSVVGRLVARLLELDAGTTFGGVVEVTRVPLVWGTALYAGRTRLGVVVTTGGTVPLLLACIPLGEAGGRAATVVGGGTGRGVRLLAVCAGLVVVGGTGRGLAAAVVEPAVREPAGCASGDSCGTVLATVVGGAGVEGTRAGVVGLPTLAAGPLGRGADCATAVGGTGAPAGGVVLRPQWKIRVARACSLLPGVAPGTRAIGPLSTIVMYSAVSTAWTW
jgi:hypothetical protein